MKNDTYIKLYRKILDNKPLCRDHTAFVVFIWLLLRADYHTGKIETGRFAASEDLNIKPTTYYQATLRLSRNLKLIDIASNNRFSVISILKWHRFQIVDNNSVDNRLTTKRQQNDTIQEVKKLRKVVVEKKYPNNTVSIAKLLGVDPTDGLDRYLNELYPDYSFKEMTLRLIEYYKSKGKKPTILAWMNWVRGDKQKGQLERKER